MGYRSPCFTVHGADDIPAIQGTIHVSQGLRFVFLQTFRNSKAPAMNKTKTQKLNVLFFLYKVNVLIKNIN